MLFTGLLMLSHTASIVDIKSRVDRCNSHNIPPSWVEVGKPTPFMGLNFGLLLPQHNVSYLEKLLVDRSDPQSKKYGEWLSKPQIDLIVGSDTKHFEVINDWLDNTISNYHCNHTADSLYCKTTVANINDLFMTEMLEYRGIGDEVIETFEQKCIYADDTDRQKINNEVDKIIDMVKNEIDQYDYKPEDFLFLFPIMKKNLLAGELETKLNKFFL